MEVAMVRAVLESRTDATKLSDMVIARFGV